MLKKERQAYILRQVNLHNKVLSSVLSAEINVSEDTIRRDLQELAVEGKLIKVHGGALSHSFHETFQPQPGVYLHDQKKVIARKAAALIQEGMFVLTSGGTTIIELARTLPHDLRATFISGSIPAVLEYSKHPNIDVIMIGDRVSKNARITTGGEAITKIQQIRADYCFLGINAIDVKHGTTDSDWDIVQVKKAMADAAQKVVCLTVSEKINTRQPIHICDISKIDILITELEPEHSLLQPYRDAGVEIL
mgnify:FL=1